MDHVEKLKTLLIEGRLTQTQLAEQVGVSFVSLNSWINGRAQPRKRARQTIDNLYADLIASSALVPPLTPDQLDDVLTGGGGSDAVAILGAAKYAEMWRRLDSLTKLLSEGPHAGAVSLLRLAISTDPYAAKSVLKYPHVGVWSKVCLDSLQSGPDSAASRRHADHLAAVAATCAWKCNVGSFSIHVPVISGGVHFPGVGFAAISGDVESASVELTDGLLTISVADKKAIEIDDPDVRADGWQPVRRLTVTSQQIELDVVVDDMNPYRSTGWTLMQSHPCLALDDVDFKNWKELVADAWEILVRDHREYASGIAQGVDVIVPIDDDVRHLTAFYRDGFGALATTMPTSANTFAQSLLEESQRMKASGLHALVPLYAPDDNPKSRDEKLYFGPWGGTPLSFEGLIEGFYAMVSTVEYWAGRSRLAEGEQRLEAEVLCNIRRTWEDSTYFRLATNQRLTSAGRDMLEAMHRRCAETRCDVAPEITEFTRCWAIDRYLCFRVANLRADSTDVERLGNAWLAGLPCPVRPAVTISFKKVLDTVPGWKVRRQLGELRLAHPEIFSELAASGGYRVVVPGATPSDVHSTALDWTAAISGYIESISASSEDLNAWAGLASVSARSQDELCNSLGRFPEVIAALHGYLRTERNVVLDPLKLARWIEPLTIRMDDFAFEE